LAAPGRFSKKVITALASRTTRFMVGGDSELALVFAVFEEEFQSGGVGF